jgi:hypothetical protein
MNQLSTQLGLKAAGSREPKTLEDFDWDFNRTRSDRGRG